MEETTVNYAEQIEKLKQAVEVLKRGGVADLAAAYTAAWGQIDNVVKNAANPHFGSNYADLAAVLDTIRPVFSQHGLSLLTAPSEMDGDKVTLMWTLFHRSGQHMSGKMSLPIGAKATAQAAGSAITYMRRYLSASIGGIAQVDDDGNAASRDAGGGAPKKAGKPAPAPQDTAGASSKTYADTVAEFKAQIKECTDVPSLEALKPDLAALGDQEVADAYAARKRELKGKK
jgi:hypothetical protein